MEKPWQCSNQAALMCSLFGTRCHGRLCLHHVSRSQGYTPIPLLYVLFRGVPTSLFDNIAHNCLSLQQASEPTLYFTIEHAAGGRSGPRAIIGRKSSLLSTETIAVSVTSANNACPFSRTTEIDIVLKNAFARAVATKISTPS